MSVRESERRVWENRDELADLLPQIGQDEVVVRAAAHQVKAAVLQLLRKVLGVGHHLVRVLLELCGGCLREGTQKKKLCMVSVSAFAMIGTIGTKPSSAFIWTASFSLNLVGCRK